MFPEDIYLAERYTGGNKMIFNKPVPSDIKFFAIDGAVYRIYYRRGNNVYVETCLPK